MEGMKVEELKPHHDDPDEQVEHQEPCYEDVRREVKH